MGAGCAAIEDGGRWRDSSPGCTTSVASSPDGNTTSRISSASCIWLASAYCCATSDLRSPASLYYDIAVPFRLEYLVQISTLGRSCHKLGMLFCRYPEIAVNISTLPKFNLQRPPTRRITDRSNALRIHRFPPHLVRLKRPAVYETACRLSEPGKDGERSSLRWNASYWASSGPSGSWKWQPISFWPNEKQTTKTAVAAVAIAFVVCRGQRQQQSGRLER